MGDPDYSHGKKKQRDYPQKGTLRGARKTMKKTDGGERGVQPCSDGKQLASILKKNAPILFLEKGRGESAGQTVGEARQ